MSAQWTEPTAGCEPGRTSMRLEIGVVAGAVGLVVVAGGLGRLLSDRGVPIHAGAAPLQGRFEIHVGVGSLLAMVIAAVVVVASQRWAGQLRWGVLAAAAAVTSAAWVMALSLVDGWQRGFVDRLTRPDEYLSELPRVGGLGAFLRDFTGSISLDSADPWTTHVSSHPPGALLPFWVLDRVGLAGGAWAATLCVVVGASAVGAVLVTVRALADEATARRLVPFLVLAPAAVWVGVSADALFLGVSAWGVCLLAVASAAERPVWADLSAVGGGLLLGLAGYLSYGLVLMVVVALAVVVAYGSLRVTLLAVGGGLVPAVVFTLAGFDWWQGASLVAERYYAGWGGERPYLYWVWADLAVYALVVGPAAVVGIAHLLASPRRAGGIRQLASPTRASALLVGSSLVAVALATLGGLSKGEVERIWLPFALWTMVACAAVPTHSRRRWLITQVVLALLVQHLVFTTW